jgi:hypothetical protein
LTKINLKRKLKKKMDEHTKKKVNSFVRSHSKNELLKMCKENNKLVSGTKFDMAVRILNIETKDTKKSSVDHDSSSLILKIAKNEFGNFVHRDSNMVFDAHSKRVIGVQLENGNVRSLQRKDIDICQKYKFQFNFPTLLDPSPIFEILENSDHEKNGNSDAEFSEAEDEDDEEEEDDSPEANDE